MAFINLVSWSPQSSETIYAWRYPETNLTTFTQLIVQESQEAVLFSKGQIIKKFGPGKHTLSTENIPLLHELFGIPFGGKNPFTAEVWFVNKISRFNIPWTVESMATHDPDYDTHLPLTAEGVYGLQMVDSEKLLKKIVGTLTQFTERNMTEQFTGEFMIKTKSTIMQFMHSNRIGYKSISAHLDQISTYLRQAMIPFWEDLGIALTKFYVTSIDIDRSSAEGRKIAEAIAQQSSMSITGHTWQQERSFDLANNTVDGMNGGGNSLLGGIMAINMMNGMGGGMGSIMMNAGYNGPSFAPGTNNPNLNAGEPQTVKMVFCSNCSKQFPSNSAFCPHCGDPYNPCPKCGTDNDPKAKRCISCGTPLGNENCETRCPNCNSPVVSGMTFCSNCGTRLSQASDNICSRCGTQLAPNAKFCPRCGNKR